MQTQYEFKITLLQQLKQLTPMFLLLVGIYGGVYYFIGSDLFNMTDGTFFYCSIAPLVICIIPVLSVHIQYLIINWSAILVVDTENKKAVFKKSNKEISFLFNDIISIGRYTNARVNSGYSAFSVYRYMRINLKDETKIIITSLMVNKIERLEIIFEKEKADTHLRLLPCYVY